MRPLNFPRCNPRTCTPNDPCASCQDRILDLDLTAERNATNRKENTVNQPTATVPTCPTHSVYPCSCAEMKATKESDAPTTVRYPIESPQTVEVSTAALRSWANELLSVLDRAEQPFTQRLAADEDLRAEVLRHLCSVRGYRLDVIEAVTHSFTFADFADEFGDDAADDDEVRGRILDSLDWDEVTDRFSRECEEIANDAIENASVEEILEIRSQDEEFAADPDVRRAVLADLTENEIKSLLLRYAPAASPETEQRAAAALAAVGRATDALRVARNTVLDTFSHFEDAEREIRAIAPAKV